MLIPNWEIAFMAGLAAGMALTAFALFLMALLYRLDDERLHADEVDFEKPKKKFILISKKPGRN